MAAHFEHDLPFLLQKESCHSKHLQVTETGSISSLSTVLFQEIEKFNRLIELLAVTLADLQKAIKGFIVMSLDLDEMYLAFLNNQIPSTWKRASFATLKPLASWYKDLMMRVSQMKLWMEKDWMPAYWMPGLFYP
jgi:dynein heavy chain